MFLVALKKDVEMYQYKLQKYLEKMQKITISTVILCRIEHVTFDLTNF